MNHKWRIFTLLWVVLLLAATVGAAGSGVDWDSLCTYGDASRPNTRILATRSGDGLRLVLPSNVSPTAVPLELTAPGAEVTVTGALGSAAVQAGAALDLNALCGPGDSYSLTVKAGGEQKKLTLVRSANVAAMYLVSDDPENRGREWVEASPEKTNKATGAMVMTDEAGETVYAGGLDQIKGRGNSTWTLDKRPYQIKLSESTDLLQTMDAANEARTWVLLANRSDSSLLRNQILLNLGAELGMEYAMENRMLDLYYDGEYRGSYLLTEKVEVAGGRVEVRDLEEANQAANPDVADLEELTIAAGVTANGASYTYCLGLESPEDITGGYLLEMELSYRTAAEACYFQTTHGNYIVVKHPEYASLEEMDYIATLYQEYEDALYNGGVHPVYGTGCEDYVDLESTAACYLINELSKNLDGFRTSAFLYKEAGVDQMKMGPLWDYDRALGSSVGGSYYVSIQQDPAGYYALCNTFTSQLYELPAFRMEVREQYEKVLYPLLRDILLGDRDRVCGSLRSLDWYRETYARTAACEYGKWYPGESWADTVAFLKSYVDSRSQWLKSAYGTWNAASFEPVSAFLDVNNPRAWFYDEVQKIAEYNLMKGTDVAVFDPAGTTNRAQVVQVLYNMARPGGITQYEQTFTDVKLQSWYGVPVSWAAAEGYVKGYPDGTFRPGQRISRQELVTFLYRFAGSPEVDTAATAGYADVGSIAKFARKAMAWAVEEGIVRGYPDNTLRPLGTTNRAELATMILRYYESYILTDDP